MPRRIWGTVTLPARREIEQQPIQRPPPTPTPTQIREVELSDAQTQVARQGASWIQRMAQESAAAFAADRISRMAAHSSNLVAEQAMQRDTQLNEEALSRAFAPRRADPTFTQMVAMSPRFQHLAPSAMYEAARLEEGRRNATEFGQALEDMSPPDRASMAPLAAALHKEGLDPEEFSRIVQAKQQKSSLSPYPMDRVAKTEKILRQLFDFQENFEAPQQIGPATDPQRQIDTLRNLLLPRRAVESPEEAAARGQRLEEPLVAPPDEQTIRTVGHATGAYDEEGDPFAGLYGRIRDIEAPLAKFVSQRLTTTGAGTELPGQGIVMEAARPTNWVPLPVVDPLIARGLGLAGRTVARVTPPQLRALIVRAMERAALAGDPERAAYENFAREAAKLSETAHGARIEPEVVARGLEPEGPLGKEMELPIRETGGLPEVPQPVLPRPRIGGFPRPRRAAPIVEPVSEALPEIPQPALPRPDTRGLPRLPRAPRPVEEPPVVEAPPLPRDLAGAKPRYNRGTKTYTPKFESDVDKALYIVAQKVKSKRDDDYMAYLRTVFPEASDDAIRESGKTVRTQIGEIAKSATDEGTLDVPDTGFFAAFKKFLRDEKGALTVGGEKPSRLEAGLMRQSDDTINTWNAQTISTTANRLGISRARGDISTLRELIRQKRDALIRTFGSESGALTVGKALEERIQAGITRGVKVTHSPDVPLGSSFLTPDGRFLSTENASIHIGLASRLGYQTSDALGTNVTDDWLHDALDDGLVRITNFQSTKEIGMSGRDHPSVIAAAQELLQAGLGDRTASWEIYQGRRGIAGGQTTIEQLARGNVGRSQIARTKAAIEHEEANRDLITRIRERLRDEGGFARLGRGDKAEPELERILKDTPKTSRIRKQISLASGADANMDAVQVAARASGVGQESPPLTPPTDTDIDGAISAVFDQLSEQEIVHGAANLYRNITLTGNSRAGYHGDVLRSYLHDAGIKMFDLQKAKGDLAKFGVTPKREGLNTHWLNVTEHPEDYNIPADLRKAIDYNQSVIHRYVGDLVDRGLAPKSMLEKPYQRRIVIEVRGDEVRVGPRRGVGAKQGFNFPRSRETVDPAGDVDYMETMSGTLEVFVKEAHHRIAGYDFAKQMGIEPREFTTMLDESGGEMIDALSALGRRQITGGRTLRTTDEQKKLVNEARNKVSSLQRRLVTAKAKRGIWGTEVTRLKNRKATAGRLEAAQAKVDKFNLRIGELTEELAAAKDTRKGVKAEAARVRKLVAKPTPSEGYIMEPFAGGRVFSNETREAFKKEFGRPEGIGGHALQAMAGFNNLFRPLWAQIDLSFLGLQALPGIGRNPRAGLSMTGRTIAAALLDPHYYDEVIAKNTDVVDDMITNAKIPWYGSEFAFDPSLAPSGIVGAIEKGLFSRGPFKISNDTWNRALNLLTLDLYKQHMHLLDTLGEQAIKDMMQEGFGNIVGQAGARSGKEMIGAALSHFTGRLSIPETAGQRPFTKLLYSAVPFAGRYWAGWLKGMTAIARRDVEGKVARRMFAGWVTAGVGFYTTLAYATGQEPKLDPISDPYNFLTLTMPDGTKVGIGGPLQQTIVLIGKVAQDPTNAHEISAKWLRGKASPAITMAADIITGETFTGEPVDVTSFEGIAEFMSGKLTPFVAQDVTQTAVRGLIEREPFSEIGSDVLRELKAAPGSAAGLRSYPQSPFDTLNQLSQEAYGKDFTDLLPVQKAEVRQRAPEAVEELEQREQRERSAEEVEATAFGLSQEVGQENASRISEAARLVESGDLTRKEFRDTISNIDLQARGQRQVIERLFEQAGISLDSSVPPYENPRSPDEQTHNDLWEYFNIFEQHPDADINPLDREALFEDIDRFRSNLTPVRELALDRNVGVPKQDIQLYQELRRDRRSIADAGYYDLSDRAWGYVHAELQQSYGETLPDTYREYQREAQDRLAGLVAEEYPQLGDLPPEAFSALLQRDGIVKGYQNVLKGLRNQWLVENPDLTRLLTKWGYRSAIQDLGILVQEP